MIRQRRGVLLAAVMVVLLSQTGCDKKLSDPALKALGVAASSAAEAETKWGELSDTLMALNEKEAKGIVKWSTDFGTALADRSVAYNVLNSTAITRPKYGKAAQDKIAQDIKASHVMLDNFSYFAKRCKGGKSDAEYAAWVSGMKACLEKHSRAVAELGAELLAKEKKEASK